MAKKNVQTQSVDAPAQPVVDKAAEAEAKKAAREAKKNQDRFVFLTDKVKGKKLAPQAQGIVGILQTAGAEGLTREQLVNAMRGVITTRQPEGRILSYYQKTLVEAGFVKIEDAAA
jgi:hypothetical protein